MHKIILSIAMLFLTIGSITIASAQNKKATNKNQKIMTLTETKQSIVGDWVSIAPEIRPSASKNADGTLKPFYLTRAFKYLTGDKFELEVVNSVDAYGKVPLVKILLKGHIVWQGEHPIAAGAQKVDFIADAAYEVTPLIQGFADAMNQVASKGFAKWEVNNT